MTANFQVVLCNIGGSVKVFSLDGVINEGECDDISALILSVLVQH